MTVTHNFLLEIGTEDLPAKSLASLSSALGREINKQLAKAELPHGDIKLFATPRRLGVIVHELAASQEHRRIERRGPAVSAAYDSAGKPSKACVGFAQSCGVSVEQLQTIKTDKGEFLFFSYEQAGELTDKLLPHLINEAIKNLPLAKPMRWNSGETEFIRPVHWVVMLLDNEIVDGKILNIRVSRHSHGHRFHHPQTIDLNLPDEYQTKLLAAKVMVDFSHRKETIRQQLIETASPQGKALIDEELLNEVTALVEWPVALMGNFEARFLKVPKEALISSMKTHQKYFPVVDTAGNLLPHFITVCNIESQNPQRVIEGNERVIRARLSDAAFFYNADLKHSLTARGEELNNVIFQRKLGTLWDKAMRLSLLTQHLAKIIGVDTQEAKRAGELAKSDLVTNIVGEFPELQGIAGYYYALHDKEAENVAIALKEQYLPRFASDALPETPLGCILAIADRIDTLIGIFGINQAPTSEKDPYGLRRSALGILRIIIEKKLSIDLKEALEFAKNSYAKLENNNVVTETLHFIFERLRAWYADQGIDADVFAAVLACNPTSPLDFEQRIKAIQYFQTLPAAKSLAAANKRVSNILKKQGEETIEYNVNPALFEIDAERNLAKALEEKSRTTASLHRHGKYNEILTELATLQQPVDDFFNSVMVMADDKNLRHNRLALLQELRQLFLQVGDISLLQLD